MNHYLKSELQDDVTHRLQTLQFRQCLRSHLLLTNVQRCWYLGEAEPPFEDHLCVLGDPYWPGQSPRAAAPAVLKKLNPI